ncbi:type II secretion system protein Z [Vibrio hannami]|uniref:AAA family ATPase n=1 Tax=Vibrio hannami TaxID=2717094 RepID=UPI00240FE6AD|nr:type II secretion system protein Z [Vibrio hannami]MDG3085977.1 type II secretion system protein Z [Vibrio hannami]
MFDLADILKTDPNSSSSSKQSATDSSTVLFYQTEDCRSLVLEAHRFEGMPEPAIQPNHEEDIKQYVRDRKVEIVILELNDSEDVIKDAEKVNHLLPNDASVIVVGSEDAISTIRNLKQLGFYYLFWPITKQELTEFVKGVAENRNRNKGLGKKRIAKQISFVGCKGGVGTTFLASEIGYVLSEDKSSSCVMVDNAYHGGNLDIMLGIEKFEKRQVRSGNFISSLDSTTSQSMLTRQSKFLSVLSLASEDLPDEEVHCYTKTVTEFLAEDVNFILDDISSSCSQTITYEMVAERSDCIVLVFSPTVSAVREAAKIRKRILDASNNEKLRLIFVLNRTIPDSCATVSQEEIDKFLRQPVDVEIPYVKKLDALLLDNKRIWQQRGKPAKAIERLASKIIGKEKKTSGSFLPSWLRS